jgi:hypothetical protein
MKTCNSCVHFKPDSNFLMGDGECGFVFPPYVNAIVKENMWNIVKSSETTCDLHETRIDGPDAEDGHDWEGFPGGCGRFNCGPNCGPENNGGDR